MLLRKCRVILMDEASSSLDHASDMALQRAIRSTFGGCTILTIAHRLNTIIASDKVGARRPPPHAPHGGPHRTVRARLQVLVLDGGRVAEFAHPHTLLSDPGSQFSSLVDEMGPETAAALRRAAEEAYNGQAAALGPTAEQQRGAAVLSGTDTPAADAGAWEGTGLLHGGAAPLSGKKTKAKGGAGGRYGT